MTRLADLVATSARVADTSGRNAKIELIAAFLRSVEPGEIGLAVGYLSGVTRQGRTGIGYALLSKASAASPAVEASLALADLDSMLERVATTTGAGSGARRAELLDELFRRATSAERDFIFRLVLGELRQGALEALMIEAIATAARLPLGPVRQAAMVAQSVAAVAQAALTRGEAGLARFALTLMQPVAPMLAQPASDIAEALRELGTAAIEWKLDGARVQAHKVGDRVRVFTRNRNDVTDSVPEVVDALRAAHARELILDGEAIALLPNAAPRPFQDTMRRFGRLVDVADMQRELPLSVFFFDCLHHDGRTLIGTSLAERFAVLTGSVAQAHVIPRIVTSDQAVAEAFYDDALRRGHEGVMAKSLDAPYEAGSRGAAWLKVKRTHTLDLVVLAAEWGHGRRRGWLSNLHLGARDPTRGGFVMLGKTFKGMTDEMLAWQTEQLLARALHRDDWTVHVRPEMVVEIAFNDLQASPRYPGGLALRFARVKRYRNDKTAADADTIDTVRAIHAGQSKAAQ
ncbi:MAG TPA: ATP-dependent DNA ligase [Casimicrobiaceae bacterium]|nr:ATP-dependent DNA ligase [Casimicrobiaceae bacterium]